MAKDVVGVLFVRFFLTQDLNWQTFKAMPWLQWSGSTSWDGSLEWKYHPAGFREKYTWIYQHIALLNGDKQLVLPVLFWMCFNRGYHGLTNFDHCFPKLDSFFCRLPPLNHAPETIRYGPMGPWVTLAVEDCWSHPSWKASIVWSLN